MQASLGVERVWIEDGELTVVCGAGAMGGDDIAFVARRIADGAQVSGTAAAGADGVRLRLHYADLVPAGPGREQWRLEVVVGASSFALAPGPAYADVPDPAVAFAFPRRRVGDRVLRPGYDAAGVLTVESRLRRRRTGAPPVQRRRRSLRVLLRNARGPLRMRAHRVAHAGFVLLMRRRTAPAPAADGRRRVLILLGHAWGIGGTTRTCLNVAGRLAQRHDVTILSVVRYRDAPYFPFPPGVRVIAADDQRGSRGAVERVLRRLPCALLLPMDRRMSRWASLWTDLRLARTLWRERADIVMGTRPALNTLIPALARDGVTVIGQEHINFGSHRPGLGDEIARRYRGLDVLVTLVERDREEYQLLLGRSVRVECIPNAVAELPGARASLDGPTVVAVGRLTGQKGFGRLIRAFADVVAVHPDWTLRICGEGFRRKGLERLIARHGLQNHVLLLGLVADVGQQLRRASIFAMSSRFEGLPMALIEAMSKGLPPVSFDCPTGPAEVIEHGRSGLLVPDGDVAGLARALIALIEDEPLRRRLGSGALARAGDFSMQAIGPRWDVLVDAS